jgi:hypothetical protein
MKNVILLTFLLFVVKGVSAQSSLLQDYLSVKDALVSSKNDQVKLGAQKLNKSIQLMDGTTLPAEEQKTYIKQKSTLLKLSEAIANESNLEKQRSKFAELSVLLWPIVKNLGTKEQPLFYDYCPMKQSYWISIDEAIKNPYYGSSMLTCGSISDKSNK